MGSWGRKLSHAQAPGCTHGGAALLGCAREVIAVTVVVKVEAVVAAMMEVMVTTVKFTVTAVIMKTDSSGPRISQASDIFTALSLPGGLSSGVKKRESLNQTYQDNVIS